MDSQKSGPDKLPHATDYCPFDCPRKQQSLFACMKRFLDVIENYCPLFGFTEEERAEVFRSMEEGTFDWNDFKKKG